MANNNCYIKRIRISKLFGNKDIDWELFEDVNILGGINGSGKSTILKLINFAFTLNYSSEGLFNIADSIYIDFTNGDSFSWNKINTDKYKKKGLVINNYESIKFYRNLKETTYLEFMKLHKLTYINSIENEIISSEISQKLNKDHLKTVLDLSLYNEINTRNALIVSRSLLEDKPTLEKITITPLLEDDSFTKFILNKFLEKIEYKKMSFDYKTKQKIIYEMMNDIDFRELMSTTIKNKSYESNSTIYELLNLYFKETNKTALESSDFKFRTSSDEIIDYTHLSTGEKQLLLIFLKAFNTEKKPCIFIMDEGDLGMHVEWKEKLIKTLREINPYMQIIVTTHAPSLITGWFENVKEMTEISKNNRITKIWDKH